MKIWSANSAESERATVISGAQVGADIAALRAAEACGLKTGGWMPLGFRTLLGPLPAEQVALFGLQETDERNYLVRTERNVEISDGTVRLAYNFDSPGERATMRFIRRFQRPHFDVPLVMNEVWHVQYWEWTQAQLVKWICDEEIETLNVAGNADTEIERCVEKFLVGVFQALARRED